MANYTAIADISKILVNNLRNNLSDVLTPNQSVDLKSPADMSTTTVNVFLYDILESGEISRSTMINSGINVKQYPPIYLNLYYMITVNINGEAQFKTIEEQRIMGAIIQYFHDYPLISSDILDPDGINDVDARVEFIRLTMDEKNRIWNFPNVPYKASLFYKVSPIAINSSRYVNVSRVKNVDINVESKY